MTGTNIHTICLLPWLTLDEPIPGPHAWFIPFDATTSSPGVTPELHATLARILSSYRRLDGRPVQRAVLVSDSAHPVISDASDAGAARLRADIDRLAFAFLAGNEYLEPGLSSYVNAAYFHSYFQRFGASADTVALRSRRRDGSNLDGGYGHGELSLSIPPQAAPHATPKPDLALLAALRQVEAAAPALAGRLGIAIRKVLSASSDHDFVPLDLECIALAGAFDTLAEPGGSKMKVAQSVRAALAPTAPIVVAQARRYTQRDPAFDANLEDERGDTRNIDQILRENWSLTGLWAWDLYRVRSKLDHGEALVPGASLWSLQEHLIAAAAILPLVVKSRLAAAGLYAFSGDDASALEALEPRLDADRWGSHGPDGSTTWSRLGLEADRRLLHTLTRNAFVQACAQAEPHA